MSVENTVRYPVVNEIIILEEFLNSLYDYDLGNLVFNIENCMCFSIKDISLQFPLVHLVVELTLNWTNSL